MGKRVGILGGMGPKATADLLDKIIDLTPAKKDQDHIHIIVDNNPKIPDRTGYIMGEGENPIGALLETAVRLRNNGVDFIIIPCNTAHYFYDKLVEAVEIPFVNMIEEVGKYILDKFEKCKVGLLATMGTYEGKVYEKYFNPLGIDVVVPTDEVKDMILDLIYRVKAGEREFKIEELSYMLKGFKDEKVNVVILGCTELPLIFNPLKDDFSEFNFISSTDILAKKTVELAK
ncbi:amino acid racemase [Clostridium sp. MSJ-11]|uniref:Amino acid racemase n=1 Tax=Clostridium mobile TaxID=2841512 RepID=A0ABS6EGP8_9CLOT|nr:amino acid racemase [Clostridium mobile]MBU5483896.1 amino acid racemase [Clostridium mobile]